MSGRRKFSLLAKRTSATQQKLEAITEQLRTGKYSANVQRSGILMVKRVKKKLLQRAVVKRFVILIPDGIHFFSNQEQIHFEPLEKITLTKDVRIIEKPEQPIKGLKGHVFGIQCTGTSEVHWLCSEKEEEYTAWLDAVKKVVGKLREGRYELQEQEIKFIEKGDTRELHQLLSTFTLNPNAKIVVQGLEEVDHKSDFKEIKDQSLLETKICGYIHNATILHIAVLNVQTKLVKKMITGKDKCNVDSQDINGDTALFYLSELKNEKDAVELCNMLLEAKANVDIQNRNGETALIRACQRQKWDLADLLVYKSDVNLGGKDGVAMHIAVKHKKLKIIRSLLSRGAKLDIKNADGLTPTDLAVLDKDKEIISLLLSKDDTIDVKSKVAEHYLPWAIELGKDELFKAIIFVDPQRQHYEFENKDYGVLKCNLLAKAIQHNNWNLAKILLDDNGARLDVNSDVIMKVEDKETKKHEDHVLSPLHLAIMKKHNDMVIELINAGADVTKRTVPGNLTPLMLAAQYGLELKVIDKILESKGVDIKDLSDKGENLIHLAANSDNTELVKTLIEKGVDVTQLTKLGISALSIACEKGNYNMVKYLVEQAGLDVKGSGQERVIKDSYPPIHASVLSGNAKIVKYLIEKAKAENFDIVNAGRERQIKPLHLACIYGHLEVAKVLLENGANVEDPINISDDKNVVPIHLAAGYGFPAIVGLLFEKGANIDAKTAKGMTALSFALKRFQLLVVKKLCDLGSMPDDIAIQFAIQIGKHEVIEWLEESKRKSASSFRSSTQSQRDSTLSLRVSTPKRDSTPPQKVEEKPSQGDSVKEQPKQEESK